MNDEQFGKPLPMTVPERTLAAYIEAAGKVTTPFLKAHWMHQNGVSRNDLADMLNKLTALGYLTKKVGPKRYDASVFSRTSKKFE